MEGIVIRPAAENDLPSILHLYQLSLGNTEGMRTEAYWRWKHEQNPFGRSPVLLAWKGDQLVGMRAFMRWRFQYQGQSYLAHRAVDTATHPMFQGRGIFSKLTLSLIDQLQTGEPTMIFNTPNAQSKPGYIKMGWKIFGQTPLRMKINPLHFIQRMGVTGSPQSYDWTESDLASILAGWQATQQDVICTDYSLPFLKWRYRTIPFLAYQCKIVHRNNSGVAIVFRIKKTRYVQELRINDVFYSGPEASQLIRQSLVELNTLHKPDVMTILTHSNSLLEQGLPFGFFKTARLGLTITYRKVNASPLVELAQHPERWSFSAGGVELF